MNGSKLIKVLRRYSPSLFETLPNRLGSLKGKRIVIDGTQYMINSRRMTGYGLYSHILGWYSLAKELSNNRVSAICVFDGGWEYMIQRLAPHKEILPLGQVPDYSQSKTEWLKARRDEERSTLSSYLRHCMKLLRSMGIPCIVSTRPVSAEALASSLVMSGHADYVAGDNPAALVYGAPLIQNLLPMIPDPIEVVGFPKKSIYGTLRMSKITLMDLEILLRPGSNSFPYRVVFTPDQAYYLIRRHGTIENISNALQLDRSYLPPQSTFALRDGYMDRVRIARRLFELPPLPPYSAFQHVEPHPEVTSEFMKELDSQLDQLITPMDSYKMELS
ncbi:Flap endonuclease 1 [Psilocybe cubensis]|uniref:XPG N-terminal domain-containing protein n=2 Tax=Psilocybe cubensis TaxID=181762 RepID=A0A8H8CK04_PSICU|nr:Flap endonuclease 1 [Psilocybe cubensis]KAH9478680.1 Flap endonuclease 1 [Psilocybe cubensis]